MGLGLSPARVVGRLRYVSRTVRGLLQHPGYEGTRVTPRRMANLVLNRWEHRNVRSTLRSYPVKLIVEVTNVCNLRWCPQTVIWDRWHHHWAGGGTPETFRPGYGVNDIFMHFWNRRRLHRPDGERRAQRA